jgi:hypothetical protein
MRLVDLVRRARDVRVVVDATTGSLDLEPFLHLPGSVAYTRDSGDSELGTGVLALGMIGPDLLLHGAPSDLGRMLARLRPGAQAVVVLGYEAAELPTHLLLDGLVAARAQILWATSLGYEQLRHGLLLACSDALLPGYDWTGRAVPRGVTTDLRRANEAVLSDLVNRGLRARLLDRAQATRVDPGWGRSGRPVPVEPARERLADVTDDRDQLLRSLRRARQRVDLLEARVAMLESSTSLKLGRAMIAAARRPGRESLRLPADLYAMWRGRRQRPAGSRPSHTRPPAQPVVADDSLHLVHRPLAVTPRRLVLAGILHNDTAAQLSPDAVVNRLLPHDGPALVERTHPHAVVVQASACTGAGPWALTGSGGAPDLDRRLDAVVSAARAGQRPTVLWRDVTLAEAPGLSRFAWDAQLDADSGVSLAARALAGAGREELRRIFLGSATRLRLSAIAAVAGAPDPLDERRVAVVADPHDGSAAARLTEQVLAQRHRPVEVVVPTAADPRWFAELAASGLAVRAGAPITAPWVADWTDPGPDRPPTHLLDLVCAQEGTGADAVGFVAAAAGDGSGDYTFVPELVPQLVRRSLYLSDLPPQTWSQRGYRLAAIRGGAAP